MKVHGFRANAAGIIERDGQPSATLRLHVTAFHDGPQRDDVMQYAIAASQA